MTLIKIEINFFKKMANKVKKLSHNGVSKSFRKTVTELEKTLRNNADGETIIVGAEDNPIVNNSDKIPIEHFFMDGVYVREMKMFKGTAVVGAIHKHLHMCFLLSGMLTVADESGTQDYIAPCYIISTSGVKRVLYAQEDSVWYNVHKNPKDIKEIKELEKEIVVLNYEEYEEYINKNK